MDYRARRGKQAPPHCGVSALEILATFGCQNECDQQVLLSENVILRAQKEGSRWRCEHMSVL